MTAAAEPSYVALHRRGELSRRIEAATWQLECCELCPRRCRVNRLTGAGGSCATGQSALVSAAHPHFGEEAPLVGIRGSGTIFFASCNLHCIFCQNWSTSRALDAEPVSTADLAAAMVALARRGCHNINLVTPSHVVPQILQALPQAIEEGLLVPLVYNSSGYDRVETLRLLDGIVDIYMPDVKFLSSSRAARYADADDYPEMVRAAVREMHRQVGDLEIDAKGIARRGLLVRHLVMPGAVDEARAVCEFLATEISRETYLNLMDQYRPCGDAPTCPEIDRRISAVEFADASAAAGRAGLGRLDRPAARRF